MVRLDPSGNFYVRVTGSSGVKGSFEKKHMR